MRKITKQIPIRVPMELLEKMSAYREENGVSVTFQLCKGAEMFLESKAQAK